MRGRAPDNITRLAEQVIRKAEGGKNRLSVVLPLPSGQTLGLIVGLREHFFRSTWEATPADGGVLCALCRRDIGALRSGGPSTADLSGLLQSAAEVVSACVCLKPSGERSAEGHSAESRPTPHPAPPPRRINFLPQEVSVCGTDAAAHTATGVIKIKVAKPGGTISQVAADAGVVTGGAPSFVYSLADGDGVGVTLTSRACELMAKHCAESNRHGREVGGILVGYSFEVEPGAATRNIHTVMTDIIPVKPSDSSGAHLSLSEQDWLHVQHLFDAKYTTQGKVRVGWYHTHPTQKVFFSNMDADTHTVFRQPHQFALVVDPRKMEAGLFYWKDYERLLLAGPLLFMLEEQADVTAGASAPSGVGSAPLSTPRLALFILVATAGWAALFWKATSGLPLTLNDMNLTALGLLAGLRLWNGGFFRPRRASTRKGQSGVEEVRAGWGEYAPRGRRWLKERSSKALATFLLGVLMLGGLILYLQDRRDTPVTRVTQQQTANKAEAVPSNDAAQQRTTLVIMLSDGIRDGKATRTLTSLGTPGAQVTYVAGNPMDGHEIWNVVGGLDEEREFLKSVFKLGLSDGKNDTNDKKVFQSALGITNGDGDWGPTTRETFVRKAAELRESGEPLMFRLGQAEVRAKFVDGGSRRTTTGRH